MGMMLSVLLVFVFVLCFDDNVFDTNGLGETGPRRKRSMAFSVVLIVLFSFFQVDLDAKYSFDLP